MDNLEINALLKSLDAPDTWQPNAPRALARVKRAPRGIPWLWAVASVSTIVFALFALPERGTCGQSASDTACRKAAINYKEAGPPNAPIEIEVYLDYECPPCAAFFLQTMPAVMATGKVRLLYHDFPLPSHPYAAGAARYANAAGEAGFYSAAVDQLFRTQAVWKQTGNIDQELSKVLPLAAMRKVRALAPGQSLSSDIAMGTIDQVNETPTIIRVRDGKREKISAAELVQIR